MLAMKLATAKQPSNEANTRSALCSMHFEFLTLLYMAGYKVKGDINARRIQICGTPHISSHTLNYNLCKTD